MKPDRRVKIVKRDERARAASDAAKTARPQPEFTERQLKTVVSGWVREHKERSEEYRRVFVRLLEETGLRPSRA